MAPVNKVIELFRTEDMELALVSFEDVEKASREMERRGDYGEAGDIFARYDNMQEELRYMAAEMAAEFE